MNHHPHYLAAYDVRNPRRRQQALRILLDYSIDRQKSVFECILSAAEHRQLMERLAAILDPEEDRFLLIRLDPRCPGYSLEGNAATASQTWFYVG